MTKPTYEHLEAKIAMLQSTIKSHKSTIAELEYIKEAVEYCFEYNVMEECNSIQDVMMEFENREDNEAYMADQADLYESTFENSHRERDL